MPAHGGRCGRPTWNGWRRGRRRRRGRDPGAATGGDCTWPRSASCGGRPPAGTAFPFALTYDGRFVGQVTVGSIVRGSAGTAYVGYWIEARYAGFGIMPTALALVVDHCFGPAGLHRIEANIRPENVASRRVVEKLGFREEGMRLRYLHVDGAWQDHVSYAITKEDVPFGLLARWRAAGGLDRLADAPYGEGTDRSGTSGDAK